MATADNKGLEQQLADWRTFLLARQAIRPGDADELEDHLRDLIFELMGAGLDEDEAFLVAVKRMGDLDAVSREYAMEYTERAWKHLVHPAQSEPAGSFFDREFVVVLALACCAALAIKVPELFGQQIHNVQGAFYLRNLSFFALPFLAGYFFWKRNLSADYCWKLGLPFVAAAIFVNTYPFRPEGSTEILSILHLPIALWLVIGLAYTGDRWPDDSRRMDFVRYTGELFIYFVLLALGGGVLTALTIGVFNAIGMDLELFATGWILPCGAMGAIIIGSWLVEAKQSVIENMAPVLTRVFTPLFTLMLLAFLGAMLFTGQGIDVARDVLIGFDLLLVVVLGLLLYSITARDAQAPPDYFDILQLVLVLSALLVDLFALVAIGARISEYGFSPNKVAALGENLILLVNLSWSAHLYWQFIRGRRPFATLAHWQMAYLPVYSLWAALVVLVFPPLFNFV